MTPPAGAGELPEEVRAAAAERFGDRLPLVLRYAELLATDGVVRGLIGPREAPRLWDRHLLNSAAVSDLVPSGATVTDVGAGAGLPGIPLALARPDLRVTLLESMARRTTFLTEAVAALELTERVTVVRGRAEEMAGRLAPARVVAARALAPLDRLAQWCLPLTRVGGSVLAIKGSSAEEEITAHAVTVRRLGGGPPALRRCPAGAGPPVIIVEIVRRR